MDVRCAQCQAEYELDDTLVAERGTAVCCTRCGFRFRAYRPAGAAAGAPERWVVRTVAGATLTFLSLRDLQEAIVLRRVGPQDALTRGPGPARSLASIVEFRSLFEAARRGNEALAKARPSMPTPAGLGDPSRPSLPLGLGAAFTPPGGVSAFAATPPKGVSALAGTPPGGVKVPAGTPSGGVRAPGGTPSGGVRAPAGTPSGGQAPATMPSGGGRAPATMPSGGQAPASTPPGGSGRPSWLEGKPGTTLVGTGAGHVRVPAELTPPALTPPEGVSASQAGARRVMPSVVRTIPFGEENERPVREAVEAALGRRGAGAPAPARQVYQGETTAPLFTGHESGQERVSQAGGVVMNAATPQAFVAPGEVTPPDGRARPPHARAAGGEARGRRGAGGALPWASERPPRTPALRWFVAAAAVIALGAGLAVHKGLAPAGRGPAAAPARPGPGQIDELVAAAEAALGRGDVDAALEAYAKAKALERRDARVAIGFARASVLRAEGPWWRLRLLPEAALGARAAATGELAQAAERAGKAVEEAAGAAPGEVRVHALRVDVRRLSGDLSAARAFAAPLSAASAPDAAYAWAALRLSEGGPPSAETIRLLREAAAGEGAAGRAAAALVYGLALAGDGPGARAELERVTAFAALPELRAWLEARADQAPERAAPAAAPAPGASPRRRARPKPAPPGSPAPPPAAREPAGPAEPTAAPAPPGAAPAPTEARVPLERTSGDAGGGAAGPPRPAPTGAPKPAEAPADRPDSP